MRTDYLCEQKLQREDEKLHRLFKENVICMQQMLMKYKNIFPTYTDHTALHSLEVIDFCNQLIGNDNIEKMNADEIYILLMSSYLHDSGMGITESDFHFFSQFIDFGDYHEKHPDNDVYDLIRDFHHEFSGEYIKKYAPIFDIPSEEYIFAITQVSRGHRKTDLFDEKEYPAAYKLPNGHTVCLPYLAALIRLADELDIAADRNLQMIYNIDEIHNSVSRMEFRKHEAIKHMTIEEKEFVLEIETDDPYVLEGIYELGDKLNNTLQYCRRVIAERTPFHLSQEKIEFNVKRGDGDEINEHT